LLVLPFIVFIKSGDKLEGEAIIHEHMHILWSVYGGMTTLFYILMQVAWVINVHILWIPVIILSWLLLSEFLAFTYTKKLATKMGLSARSFSKKVIIKYVLFYGSYIALMFTANTFINDLGLMLAFLVALYWVLGKVWQKVFEKLKLSNGEANEVQGG